MTEAIAKPLTDQCHGPEIKSSIKYDFYKVGTAVHPEKRGERRY